MIIADHPLHRSGRAALPHPAPTSGDDAQALGRIGMADSRGRKPGGQQGPHARPRQVIALTAPTQNPPPYATDRRAEGTDCGAISRDTVVTYVTENNRTQVLANLGDGVVQARFKFGLHRLKFRLPPFAHRLTQHRELAHSRLPATVREAEKVKARRCAPITALLSVRPRKAAELDQSCLLGVQFQTEVREPLAQLGKEPLSLNSMLEPNNKVIRKTHHDDITASLLLSPSLDPQVEHSGRTQAQCWCATGSSCFRLLIGRSPVPRSVPQSVSCVLHYHPGQRDFPSPVGSGDISARSLPARQAVQAMVRVRGLQFGLLHASPGWLMRHTPDTEFRCALPLQTVPAQGSFAPEALPSFVATTNPSADPNASRSYFMLRTYNERPYRLHHPRLVVGTFPTLVCFSVLECCAPYTGGLSSATNQFFLDNIGLRLTMHGSAFRKSPQNGFMWTTYFDTAGIP
jgi:hypothetical protein